MHNNTPHTTIVASSLVALALDAYCSALLWVISVVKTMVLEFNKPRQRARGR